MFLAQIDKALEVVDKASTANDRWLFLAALLILLGFVGLVIKWLVTHIEEKDKRLEAKEIAHDEKLKEAETEAAAERKEAREKFLQALDTYKIEFAAMSASINELTKIITKHDQDMRDAHRIETATLVRAELLRLGISAEKIAAGIG